MFAPQSAIRVGAAGVATAAHLTAAASLIGLSSEPIVSHGSAVAAICVAAGAARPVWLATRTSRRLIAGAVAVAVLVTGEPAIAWISNARTRNPTELARQTGGLDVAVDTHQWIAAQAIAVLAGDGHRDLAAFFDQLDPTAPGTTPLDTGTPSEALTYRWRFLRGARDADGVLYTQIPDHFVNAWTHHGRQWILGGSAASDTEKATQLAITNWRAGDRGEAIYWLGAAIHLLTDACVPQHQFFIVNPYHHQYELWVQRHADALAVTDGAITREMFRVGTGHGGTGWSSDQPRGWVDECAHRAIRTIRSASHPNQPGDSTPSDPRWRTRYHIADTQRLAAGFLLYFFDQVGI